MKLKTKARVRDFNSLKPKRHVLSVALVVCSYPPKVWIRDAKGILNVPLAWVFESVIEGHTGYALPNNVKCVWHKDNMRRVLLEAVDKLGHAYITETLAHTLDKDI